MTGTKAEESQSLWVTINAAGASLEGDLRIPPRARGVVIIPHGSGIRRGPRDGVVAQQLREERLATLLVTLMSPEEQNLDARTACFRFDTKMLATRLMAVTDWLTEEPTIQNLPASYFSGSSAAAAALLAVAARAHSIGAVVLHNGRPNLIRAELTRVTTPTLILVGGDEEPDDGLDRPLFEQLGATEKQFVVVPVSAQGTNQPGGLGEVSHLAAEWLLAPEHRATGSPRGEAQKILR